MNVLFIVYGTGGAEAIGEVVKSLDKTDVKYKVLACSDFSKSKIEVASRVAEEEAIKCIDSVDLVVSERSNGLEFQKRVTKKCKAMSIPNLVITDFYLSGKDIYRNHFDILPNYVTAMSDSAYTELSDMGFKNDQIIKLGNPAYIRLYDIEYLATFTESPKVLFISQGGDSNTPHEELVEFLGCCVRELDSRFRNYTLDIKLHPMEEGMKGKWLNTVSKNKWDCTLLDIPTSIDFLIDGITEYDLLIGLQSTLQVQGQIIGIPTIFKGGDLSDCLDKYFSNIHPLMWCNELSNYYKVSRLSIIEMFEKIKRGVV